MKPLTELVVDTAAYETGSENQWRLAKSLDLQHKRGVSHQLTNEIEIYTKFITITR